MIVKLIESFTIIIDYTSKGPKKMQGEKWPEVRNDWEYRGTETTKFRENVPECKESNIVYTFCEVEIDVG